MGNIVVADMAATGTHMCLTGGEGVASKLHACTVSEGLIGQLREGRRCGGRPPASRGDARRGYEGAPAPLRCSSGWNGAGHDLCACTIWLAMTHATCENEWTACMCSLHLISQARLHAIPIIIAYSHTTAPQAPTSSRICATLSVVDEAPRPSTPSSCCSPPKRLGLFSTCCVHQPADGLRE